MGCSEDDRIRNKNDKYIKRIEQSRDQLDFEDIVKKLYMLTQKIDNYCTTEESLPFNIHLKLMERDIIRVYQNKRGIDE